MRLCFVTILMMVRKSKIVLIRRRFVMTLNVYAGEDRWMIKETKIVSMLRGYSVTMLMLIESSRPKNPKLCQQDSGSLGRCTRKVKTLILYQRFLISSSCWCLCWWRLLNDWRIWNCVNKTSICYDIDVAEAFETVFMRLYSVMMLNVDKTVTVEESSMVSTRLCFVVMSFFMFMKKKIWDRIIETSFRCHVDIDVDADFNKCFEQISNWHKDSSRCFHEKMLYDSDKRLRSCWRNALSVNLFW